MTIELKLTLQLLHIAILYRLLEKKLSDEFTCSEIISSLHDMNFYELNDYVYTATYTRTDFTDALHDAFGFRTEYDIVTKKQMKKFSKVQNPKNIIHYKIRDNHQIVSKAAYVVLGINEEGFKEILGSG